MSVLSSILMLNIKRNNSQIIYLIIGIFSSVAIYYINVLSQTLGTNEAIPLDLSIWMPIIILSIIIMIGLVRLMKNNFLNIYFNSDNFYKYTFN